MKKRYFVFLLATALLCSLCACGGQGAPVEDAGEPETAQTDPGQMPEDAVSPGKPEDVTVPGEGEEDPEPDPAEAPGESGPDAGKPEENASNASADGEKPDTDTPPAQAQNEPNKPAAPEPPKPAPAEKPAEKPTEKPAAQTETPASPPPAPEAPAPEPEPVEPEKPAADPETVAQGLVGRPVSELYAAIGRPVSSDYAPSCLVENGEDGELTYNGFVVYTEKGDGYETVYAVF